MWRFGRPVPDRKGTARSALGYPRAVRSRASRGLGTGWKCPACGRRFGRKNRSKKQALVLGVLLSRTHPKLSKTLKLSANRVAHFIELTRISDFDAAAGDLLTESYLDSPP